MPVDVRVPWGTATSSLRPGAQVREKGDAGGVACTDTHCSRLDRATDTCRLRIFSCALRKTADDSRSVAECALGGLQLGGLPLLPVRLQDLSVV